MIEAVDRRGGAPNPSPLYGGVALVVVACVLLFVSPAAVATDAITVDNARSIVPLLTWATGGVPVFGLVFSPDGTQLYGAQGHQVVVWDSANGTVLRSWPAHPGYAAGISLSPDGLWIATAGDDAVVRIWNAATGDLRRELSPGGTHSVAFSNDGTLIASACRDEVLRVWSVETGDLVHAIPAGSRMFGTMFSPDDAALATAHGLPDFAVRLWSVETGDMVWESFEHRADAHVVGFWPSRVLA